jgi:hypothetical protein
MTANVLILIVQKTQVVAVPNEALRFRPVVGPAAAGSARAASTEGVLGAAVYVPEGTRAVRTSIKTGVTDGNMTEVEGLAPGSDIIIESKIKPPPAAGAH